MHHFSLPIAGVEQTTSGYKLIGTLDIKFPVVNVARSIVKLEYEAPMVAKVAMQRILEKLRTLEIQLKNILIIGNGNIGSAFKPFFEGNYDLYYFDIADSPVYRLDPLLSEADLILGCTGTTSVPVVKHHLLKKGSVLASISSSDREFDSVFIRKKIPAYNRCHTDIKGDIMLLNSGFPVNFNGGKNSVKPEKIQLIRALLTLGVLQASQISESQGLIDLDLAHQQRIKKIWGGWKVREKNRCVI